jgi:hypothetical protein
MTCTYLYGPIIHVCLQQQQKTNVKSKFVFHCGKSAICQVRAAMVPDKFDVINLLQFAQKIRWRVLAARAILVVLRTLAYRSRHSAT